MQQCAHASFSRCLLTRELWRKRAVKFDQRVTAIVQVCGPPSMMTAISGDKAPDKSQGEVSGLLASMGYTKDHVYKF